jgi:hypothetical protein
MAASIRETIILAAKARIEAEVSGIIVYRSREAALSTSQLPAIVLSPVTDTPVASNSSLCWLNWTLDLAVDVITGEGLDSSADIVVQEVHAAMVGTNRTLGLAAVSDVVPGPVVFVASNREQPVGVVRCSFDIKYRTRHGDLTAAPT